MIRSALTVLSPGFARFAAGRVRQAVTGLLADYRRLGGLPITPQNCRADLVVSDWRYLHTSAGCTLCPGVRVETPDGDPAPGEGCYLGRRAYLGPATCVEVSRGRAVVFGDRAAVNSNCHLRGDVRVGRYALFGPDVFVSSGTHAVRHRPTQLIRVQDAAADLPGDDQRAVIDEDCWIGKGALIRHGVHIGRGAVIGANAVVTRSVAPYTVVAGVPATQIGVRLQFDPPRELRADVESDRPYFYAGFFHDPDGDPPAPDDRFLWAGRYARLVLGGPARRVQLDARLAPTAHGATVEVRVNGSAVARATPPGPGFVVEADWPTPTVGPDGWSVVELIVDRPTGGEAAITAGYIEPVPLVGVGSIKIE